MIHLGVLKHSGRQSSSTVGIRCRIKSPDLVLEERSQLFALSFLEEGLLIRSQSLFSDRLPAFGLLSSHFGASFTSKFLCRLI